MSPAGGIRVLTNASALVESIGFHGPQAPAELAVRTGMPRSSVYRLVEGLEAIGLVVQLEDSRVGLSSRWLHLADSTRAAMVEWAGAGAVLEDIVESTGQTAYLTVRRGDQAVCIDWRQGRGIGVLVLKPGLSLPLYAGAAGRVLMSFGDHEAVLSGAPYPAVAGAGVITRSDIEREIAMTREQGFAVSDEDVTRGIGALGVPVIGEVGEVRAALSVAGIAAEIRDERVALLDALRIAVDRLGSDAPSIS